jgi:hypothetical protein
MIVSPSFFAVISYRYSAISYELVLLIFISLSWIILTCCQLLQVVQICSSTTKKAGHLMVFGGIYIMMFIRQFLNLSDADRGEAARRNGTIPADKLWGFYHDVLPSILVFFSSHR